MIELGKYNNLEVVKEVSFGLYLNDEARDQEEILLPLKYITEGTKVGDTIKVFVYNDSENRPIATTLVPLAVVGEFAFLMVIDVAPFGAFLDLGIAKDVLVPLKEQAAKMRLGHDYIVYLYIDNPSGRIVASSKWSKFIERDNINVQQGDEVELLIAEQTDLGFKAIINNKYLGLIYHNEIFEPIFTGDKKRGFIKRIREENKIDLSLQAQGYGHIEDSKDKILEMLKRNGSLEIGDKSTPEEIFHILNLSKKAFKKTIGGLYKDGLVELYDHQVKLK